MFLIGYLILCLLSTVQFSAAECSFSQVEKIINPRNVTLSWSLVNCQGKLGKYDLDVEHVEWKACRTLNDSSLSLQNHGEEKNVRSFKTDNSSIVLTDLHPYSVYHVKIKAFTTRYKFLTSNEFEVETASDIPQTIPRNYTKGGSEARASSLTFHWESPDPQDCQLQNGQSDGYLLKLYELDSTGNQVQLVEEKNEALTYYHNFNLKTFTQYELRVYSQNFQGLVNEQKYLQLKNKTSPSEPKKPVNLTGTPISSQSVFLSWYPHLPKTGEIESYQIKNGSSLSNINGSDTTVISWKSPVSFPVEHFTGSCSANHSQSSDKICYVVTNLKPSQTYYFSVRVKNKDIYKKSAWSSIINITTPDLPYTSSSTTEEVTYIPEANIPVSYNPDRTTILTSVIVVMVSLVFICIVAIFFRYRWKLKALKERLRLEQAINMSRQDSMYMTQIDSSYQMTINSDFKSNMNRSIMTETSRLDSTSSPDQSFSSPTYLQTTSTIQSRRLPEPPPSVGRVPGLRMVQQQQQQQSYDVPPPSAGPGYLNMSLGRAKKKEEIVSGDGDDEAGYMKTNFPRDLDRRSEEIEREVVPIPAASYGVAGVSESDSSNQNLLTYQRPDLLPSEKCERASAESENSNDSNKHLLEISEEVQV